jgi:hypothetical protein
MTGLAPEQRDVVRAQVRDLLTRTPAFSDLEPTKRREIARGLVTLLGYLADPNAGQPRSGALADTAGKDFRAGAVREGTEAFQEMVGSVDFPQFVSGLIEGVFTSIVNSSIRQMEAYGKLLEGVAKSVEQFASEHVTSNQARDWLVGKYPSALSIDTTGASPKLAMNEELDDAQRPDLGKDLGLKQVGDLADPESEAAVVRAAQLEMARLRQKQLATMVLLGINRIVVTDGLINAKVVFDMKASDRARRGTRATSFDRGTELARSGGGGWLSNTFDNVSTHETVVTTATDDSSESKAEVKAKLSGEVRVNFKSETFPLERMASGDQIASVQERAQP